MNYRPIKPGNRPTLLGSEAYGTQIVGRNGYDLTLDVMELDDPEPRLSFRAHKYLHSAESTQLLFESYMRLVRAFAARFDAPVDSGPLWHPRDIEMAKILGRGKSWLINSNETNQLTWNAHVSTGPEYRSEWPETVSHRIAQIASQNPGCEAVKDDGGCSLSYEKMQHRVQHISNSLASAGVREGSRVAVFQEPTADWICSLLAIWHSGATYVPLDLRITKSLPSLAVIARVARPSAILCHNAIEAKVPELKSLASIINVSGLGNDEVDLTDTKAKATTAGAVLFTSGSTGVPKGVILPHRAFKTTFEGLTRHCDIESEKMLQQSAFTFDFSLDQILISLTNVGTVYVVSKEKRSDASVIVKIIDTEVSPIRASRPPSTPAGSSTATTVSDGPRTGTSLGQATRCCLTRWRRVWASSDFPP